MRVKHYMNIFGFTDVKALAEAVKLVIIVPVFLFWSLYDILTKTVRVKWQRSLLAFGILYNVFYLFIDKNQVNDNITGFLICYGLTFLYSLIKKLLGFGTFGQGDVMYCGIIGLLFGTAVGVLTIALAFLLFDGILEIMKLIFKRLGSISVAFFPFITAGLFIILFWVGETRVEEWYNWLFSALHVPWKSIKLF